MKYITNKREAEAVLRRLPAVIQVDSETTGLHFIENDLLIVQIGFGGNQYLFDVRKIGKQDLAKLINPVLASEKTLKIIQNALFDVVFFMHHFGSTVRNIYDTELAESVLTCGQTDMEGKKISASLKDTLERRGIAKLNKEIVMQFISDNPEITDEMLEYAADDVKYLEKLMNAQLKEATKEDRKIIDLENKVVEVTAQMRFHGIAFDEKAWLKLARENKALFDAQLKKMPKDVNNWNSPTQVKEYFGKKGIRIDSYADLDVMRMEVKNKTFQEFCNLRDLYQNVKLFGENWLTVELNNRAPIQTAKTVQNGRVHGNFHQIMDTGRYSSVQPNLQQLPASGDHRKCFLADPGHSFVIADYTGQEIATAAVASGEYRWIHTIQDGGNIHDLMTEKIFGPGYTKEQRNLIKRINFAILYGSGASTIARNMLIPASEAASLIRKWKAEVPILRQWLFKQYETAERTRMSYSLYGRKRFLGAFKNAYTVGQNNPIQATGADMIKVALVKLHEYFQEVGWGTVILCIHDEIITQVPKARAAKFIPVMKKLMEEAAADVLDMEIVTTEPYIAQRWEKPKTK